jgi:phosphoribosylformimino-5-aminoimidazole carboxamide ribonucleotide (ProFAR) isomerase
VRTAGWTAGSGIGVDDALARAGGQRVLVTAIDRDGTLTGPDLALVRRPSPPAAACSQRAASAAGRRRGRLDAAGDRSRGRGTRLASG